MINSLMSRMGEAQKLSIPQLQKAIQDGTLPPYVGIPLLQDKMRQQQMAQAKPQQQQPPIAQQVMQEASMHDRGVEALPTNLPTEEMYDGGIVAFAGGDLVGDQTVEDYQDQAEEEEDQDAMQAALENQAAANEGIGSLPNKGSGMKFTEPVPAGASKGIDADMARKHNVGNLRPVGFKYEGQIGVSPGGFAMFENRDYGIKALNHDIGVKLDRGLNTPEKFISVYAPASDKNDTSAYIRNVSNALGIKPNQEIPNTPEARMILAQAITRQEGAEKATARFAEGGIAHFSAGGVPVSSAPSSNVGNLMMEGLGLNGNLSNPSYLGEGAIDPDLLQSQMQQFEQPVKRKMTYETKGQMGPTDSELQKNASIDTSTSKSESNIPSESITTKPIDPYQALMDKLDAREENAKKQKTIDGYMGLLTAGLGMVGGSSPYAMENIGKGALAGVQQYGESQKLAASETANRDKTMASLIRAKQLGDISQATQRRLNTQFQQAQSDKVSQQAQSNFQQALKMRQAALAKDPTFLAKSEAEQNSLLYSDPVIQRYAQAAGFDPSLFGGSGSSGISSDAIAAEKARRAKANQ